MNNKKNLLIIFSFLLLINFVNAACSYTGPCQGGGYWCLCNFTDGLGFNGSLLKISDIGNMNLYGEDTVSLSMNWYFMGYNQIEMWIYNDSTYTYANPIIVDYTTNSTWCEDWTGNFYCLVAAKSGTVDYITLNIKSKGLPRTDYILLFGINTSDDSAAANHFNITFTGEDLYNPNTNLSQSSSWFAQYAGTIKSMFPDSESLSLSDRLSVVIVFLFILVIGAYLFIYVLTKQIPQFYHYIVFLLVVLSFFYFLAISYIPIVFFVVIALILFAVTYLRLKSGSPSG